MKKSDVRRYARIRVREDELLTCKGVKRALKGLVSILGPGGMFVRTRDICPVGTAFTARIHGNGEVLEAECLVRDVLPGGLGVQFTRLRGKHGTTLKKLLKRLAR